MTSTQGLSRTKKSKNFCTLFLVMFSIDLNEIEHAVVTCWCGEVHINPTPLHWYSRERTSDDFCEWTHFNVDLFGPIRTDSCKTWYHYIFTKHYNLTTSYRELGFHANSQCHEKARMSAINILQIFQSVQIKFCMLLKHLDLWQCTRKPKVRCTAHLGATYIKSGQV